MTRISRKNALEKLLAERAREEARIMRMAALAQLGVRRERGGLENVVEHLVRVRDMQKGMLNKDACAKKRCDE